MRSFTRMAAAAALLALAASSAPAQEWTTVRIGTDATYPPFEYVDANGEIVGFSIEIAEALCAEMQVECEFINQDWEGIIPALQANRFDAIISSMAITEERKQQVDFTNKYYQTPNGIIVPKESELTGVSPEELSGATIGTQVSTIHANYVEEKYPDAELRAYPSAEEYKLDLASGRIDAAMDDSVVLNEWLESEDGACCKLLGLVETDPVIHGEGAGIAIRKEDTALRDMFNEALEAIRADGTYKAINDKYFPFDVYGG